MDFLIDYTSIILTRSVDCDWDSLQTLRLFGCLNEIVCHCPRQFVWVRRISRWCIPPSLSSFCCSWSSPVNLLSMERWRPNMWPMPNTTRWVSVLFPPHVVFTFSSVFKMVDLLLFCLSWSLLFYDSPYTHLSSS